jgi:hypothetical protein
MKLLFKNPIKIKLDARKESCGNGQSVHLVLDVRAALISPSINSVGVVCSGSFMNSVTVINRGSAFIEHLGGPGTLSVVDQNRS